jgi:SAM-dependent methyltransferase
MPGGDGLSLSGAYPCLFDCIPATPIDAHYFYQSWWASRIVARSPGRVHVDVGSDASFATSLAIGRQVVVVDIRLLMLDLPALHRVQGTILALPFGDATIRSISCLHVAEHIGLGRYGDALNPAGTQQACAELERVLAPGGDMVFSVPLGVPRICFNAHRVLSPEQTLTYFGGLRLVSFAGVDDNGVFRDQLTPFAFSEASYACGLFHFTKNP